jgi:O-antigen/teichoic acid export membrane protein
MSVARALATNTAVQAAGKVVSTILGVIIVGLMTRLLGQEGFGMYSTANAFLQVFAILLDLGLNVLLVQMLGEHAGDKQFEDKTVSAFFTLRLIMALVVLSIAPVIGLFLPYSPELKIALFAIWGSFFFTALNQVVIGVHQRHLKMHVVAIAEVTGRTVLLVGVLIGTVMHWGLVPIVLFVSLGGFANFAINALIASRFASFKWNVDIAFWKQSLKRAWPIGVSILFSLIYYKADTLILGFVRPQTEVGIYGAAYRVLDILVTFPFMYAGVLLPVIAKAWASGQKERFAHLIQRSFDAFCLVVFPIVFGAQLVATKGMILVAGNEFIESGDVLRILVIAVGVIYISTVFSHAIVALDKQRSMLPVYIATAVFTLAGYIILIPVYGMWAAAWLTVASEIAVMLGNVIITLRTVQMKLKWNIARNTLLSAIAMYAIAQPFAEMSLFFTIVIAIVVYVILTFATKTVTKEMLTDLLSSSRGAPEGEESL